VEDESSLRIAARAILTRLGYRVLTAADGLEALGICRARGREIRLVLADVVMPGMDGKALFHALREIDPGIRMVLASAFKPGRELDDLLSMGLCGFLDKPYSFEGLSRVVGRALEETGG
jgi:DNA-binding NtrC family response regulator